MTRPVVVVAPAQRDEDRAEWFDLRGGLAIVLADGAGGRSGGREAAEAVVRGVRARARELADADATECAAVLEAVDRELAAQAHGGEATAVLVLVRGREVVGASVGDSGAWLVGPGGVRELTGRQVRKPFVGVGSATATPFASTVKQDERLLVASDGLLKYVDRDRIVAASHSGPLAQAARSLVDQARLPSGGLQDDVAVVLWEP